MRPSRRLLRSWAPAFAMPAALSFVDPLPVHAGFDAFQNPGAATPVELASNEIDSTPGTNGHASGTNGGLSTGLSAGLSAGAAGLDPGARTIRALRLNGTPIEVDGRLDDAPWRDAPAGYDFKVWDPDRGKDPTESTVFKVAYDDEALYFGVACHERDPSKVSQALSRRDQITNSDLVSIYLDPYHDRSTGYNFRVNPVGVQEDAYLYNDGNDDGERDADWDAVWEAETYSDADGWYTEVRIPFSSIRYRPADSMTWGLQLYRYMHGRGEDTAWVTWDKEKNGFISRFGTLTDLSGVPSPRQLEILPYVVSRFTDPSVEGDGDEIDDFENFGADLRYGVTADLMLNAAFQPDFGQVEADPAVLNRSPFETFYEEKRPFFVEGNRFFEHPDAQLFYSRRIGTGDERSRIRFASKLTGKAGGNVTVAGLYALTDVTAAGQAHNFAKGGDQGTQFFVGRVGKEFRGGLHRINVMQTAVMRDADRRGLLDQGFSSGTAERLSRDGYTSGLDFDLNFKDRMYNVKGALVGSIVDPSALSGDPSVPHDKLYGTSGSLGTAKFGGTWRGSLYAGWETERLDLNDAGFLSAPDEIVSNGWLQYHYTPRGDHPRFNSFNLNFNANKSWLYADSRAVGPDGSVLWEYSRGHRQSSGGNVNLNIQFRDYRSAWMGVWYNPDGSDKYQTRGGPLFTLPERGGVWVGGSTDSRKPLNFNSELEYWEDRSGVRLANLEGEMVWRMSSSVHHSVALTYEDLADDSQYLETITHDDPTLGIGGKSYIYGETKTKTVDVTLRSNLLFDRKRSLELYFQPYLAVGDCEKAKEFTTPGGYDFAEYTRDGYDPNDFDDTFAAVNLNMVYRWEYRPGSTIYLVWAHSRAEYETRASHGPGFDNGLGARRLFQNEPENTVLAKMTYWFAL